MMLRGVALSQPIPLTGTETNYRNNPKTLLQAFTAHTPHGDGNSGSQEETRSRTSAFTAHTPHGDGNTAEFISKLEGGLQELEETVYWLELLAEANIFPPITPVIKQPTPEVISSWEESPQGEVGSTASATHRQTHPDLRYAPATPPVEGIHFRQRLFSCRSNNKLENLRQEAESLTAILVTSVKTAKERRGVRSRKDER